MAILVVGGSGKDVGKTSLVCAIIASLREFNWTAVKITGHDYGPAQHEHTPAADSIREETNAGQGTDTARYLAAGACRALLVTRARSDIPIDSIRRAIAGDQNVIFESNRIIDVIKPDLCLALMSGEERKPSFNRLLRIADASITTSPLTEGAEPKGRPLFQLTSVDRLSEELLRWLKQRLLQANH